MKAKLLIVACCSLYMGAPALAQQMPKPGPEHELLKKFAGDWDCTISIMGMESKGTSSNKLSLGGFWLLTDFQGEFGGMKFEGKGAMGYDTFKKKYVSSWIDSMSPTLSTMEGKLSEDGKTYTEIGEGYGMDGKLTKMKNVHEFKDADTITFAMYHVVDGKDQEAFKITYKRKK